MKIVIISSTDSLNTLDLMQACASKNVECSVYALSDLSFAVERMNEHEFFSNDVYIFRGYNRNYNLALTLAQILVQQGKTVLDNRLASGFIPSKFNEAVIYKAHGIKHIPTYNAGSTKAWQAQNIHLNYPVVIKDIDSQRGKGVRLCTDEQALLDEIERNRFGIIIQDFLPMKFDIRVICIGGKVIGAIKREAADMDFRTNISLGGRAEVYELNDEERTFALQAHRSLKNDISGVDITYDTEGNLCLIETNITPEWQGFKQATGIDVAAIIIEYITEL